MQTVAIRMNASRYRKIASLKTSADFRQYVRELGIELPFCYAGGPDPLAQRLTAQERAVGNRFCVLPMEGWDCEPDGRPGELTRRRWRRFGESGAKLVWGGEACAVSQSGRSNPRQMMINDDTVEDIAALRELLVGTHEKRFDSSADLLVGLQLTHSGRFARPAGGAAPIIVYNHPLLDEKVGLPPGSDCLSDNEATEIVEQHVKAAVLARNAGFDFVDVKHCHGYLGHEFLSAHDRPGRYGGTFENRTRFLREIIEGIRSRAPELEIGVRLSVFDFAPFVRGSDGVGQCTSTGDAYRFAFGGDGTGTGIDLREPLAFVDLLCSLGIRLVCATAGSPYYCPHVQRPAMFPPSDGYLPPEDPLVGVARQINATAELKKRRPDLILVGSGYTYLQEYLPHVARGAVAKGLVDSVGLGRMMLSYPDIVADILSGAPLNTKRICRTVSDCTTAPRHGLVSGCYFADDCYRNRNEFRRLKKIKKAAGQ
jgi:NADPH2 dehydrogenase